MSIVYNIKASEQKGIYDLKGNTITANNVLPTLDDSILSMSKSMFFDATHRFKLAIPSPVSLKGKDWTFFLWIKSYLYQSANDSKDWSVFLNNNNDFDFRLDADHAWSAHSAADSDYYGLPTLAWTDKPFKTKVCDKKWHQLMLCHSASNNMLYAFVDGNLDGTLAKDYNVTGSTISIGGDNYARNYFYHGWADDIVVLQDECLHTKSFEPVKVPYSDLSTLKILEKDKNNKLYGYK